MFHLIWGRKTGWGGGGGSGKEVGGGGGMKSQDSVRKLHHWNGEDRTVRRSASEPGSFT